MCISLAQRIHRTDVNVRMRLLGENGAKVRPLNDTKAVENGANFLSEAFVFSVAGSAIIFETWRQRQKEKNRQETISDDIKTLQYEIEYLKKKLQDYNVRLDDYVPPKDVHPIVLQLDAKGNTANVSEQMVKLNAKIEAIDKKVEPSVEAHPVK